MCIESTKYMKIIYLIIILREIKPYFALLGLFKSAGAWLGRARQMRGAIMLLWQSAANGSQPIKSGRIAPPRFPFGKNADRYKRIFLKEF
jgi:hypothetical protein